MITSHLTAILLFLSCPAIAQFQDDFSSGTSAWRGDTAYFYVNDRQQLQSNGPASSSKLFVYTSSNALQQAEWSCWLRMNFESSTSNYAKIFLAASSADLSDPTLEAYYLKVGGLSGSKDGVDLYYQKGAAQTLVVKGIEGRVGGSTVTLRLKVLRDSVGQWSVYSDTLGGEDYRLEGSAVHATVFTSQLFGLQCIHSSTRRTNFYVDDIVINGIVADQQAPQVLSGVYQEELNGWEIIFDEELNTSSTVLVRRLEDTVPVAAVSWSVKSVFVRAAQLALQEGEGARVWIEQARDKSGNTRPAEVLLVWPKAAEKGQLVINEVLFNPFSYGVDFVELYNRSVHYLSLTGPVLINQDNQQTRCPDLIIPPGAYRVLCKDSLAVKRFYVYAASGTFVNCDLPALPDDKGSLVVQLLLDTLDQVNYSSSMHHPLLEEQEGFSLERIDTGVPSSWFQNWQSASTTSGGATPGYVNSQAGSTAQGGGLSIEPRSISPGTDGYRTMTRIGYSLPKPGGSLRMDVFSLQGHWICALQPNGPADAQGHCVWNGTDASLQPVSTGLYLIIAEFTHPDGDHVKMKGTVSVLLR